LLCFSGAWRRGGLKHALWKRPSVAEINSIVLIELNKEDNPYQLLFGLSSFLSSKNKESEDDIIDNQFYFW